jgi:flagellar motor switch protein FliM
MNNLLSKDEVETLLKGVDSGDIETELKKMPSREVQPFDFTRHERVFRSRMAGLEMANERFGRFFQNSISGILMKSVDIPLPGYDLIKFGEFMKTLPQPSSINLFKMEPLKGFALLVIESPMVFAFVDQIFGGGGNPWVKNEGRNFTPIEQKIIKIIVDTALKDLAMAWQEILPMQPQQVSSEMNPQFVTIVTPSESLIRIEIQIEIENFCGKLFFCIPYSMVEPVKEKLCSGVRNIPAFDQRWVTRLREILKESFVDLCVDIGSTELSLRGLVHLEKGNVITLQTAVSDELIIRVEGVPKMKGIAGSYRGNQGIKVTKLLEKN